MRNSRFYIRFFYLAQLNADEHLEISMTLLTHDVFPLSDRQNYAKEYSESFRKVEECIRQKISGRGSKFRKRRQTTATFWKVFSLVVMESLRTTLLDRNAKKIEQPIFNATSTERGSGLQLKNYFLRRNFTPFRLFSELCF